MAVIGIFLLTLSSALAAKQERLKLNWSDLEQAVKGRTVEMVLPDGEHIKGQVLTVSSAALVIDVKTTSNQQAYPKGKNSIPRCSVSALRLTQVRGRWRWIATAIGASTAIAVLAVLLRREGGWKVSPQKGVAIAAGLSAGAGGIGYFAGRGADRRLTVITIVHD